MIRAFKHGAASLLVALALLISAVSPAKASGNPAGLLGIAYNLTYFSMGGWCTNPGFANRPNDGNGTFWGVASVSSGNPTYGTYTTYIGYTIGEFGNTPYTGLMVNNEEQNGNRITDRVFPFNSNPPQGSVSLFDYVDIGPTDYHDIYIGNVAVIKGLFQGSPTSVSMLAMLSQVASSNTNLVFPSFYSQTPCTNLQTLANGGVWVLWPPAQDGNFQLYNRLVGNETGSGSYSSYGSSNAFTIWPQSF